MIRKKQSFLLVVGLTYCVYASEEYASRVSSVLERYTRPVTILVVGQDPTTFFQYLSLPRYSARIAWVLPGGTSETAEGITVLAPPGMSSDLLESFGRCEHCDIVVVQDLDLFIKGPFDRLLAALVRMGEHLFILPALPDWEAFLRNTSLLKEQSTSGSHRSFFYHAAHNKVLLKARFSQKTQQSMYRIVSTDKLKTLIKQDSSSPWIPGINMITFIMLYGRYPSDEHIQQQLGTFYSRYWHHSDLVLGNIIVQGTTLIPIDCFDSKRQSDSARCIKLALDSFKKGNSRLVHPQSFLNDYYRKLISPKRFV